MDEVDKMRSSQLANTASPEIQERFKRAKKLLLKLNAMSGYEEECRSVLEELIPGIPASATICPPFCCDHGDGIRLGEHVFINSNCTFLDGGYITVGAYTLIGPCVQIYTPQHPFDYLERRVEQEYAYPVTIGEDCWIGGGAVICPGVTIGDRCIIGAGSVVTKDIPSDCVAVGNPAKAKRELGWNPQKTTFEQLVKIMVDADMAKVAVERAGEHVCTNLEEYLEKGIVK